MRENKLKECKMGNSRQIYDDKNFPRIAYKFALKGTSDKELADVFEVNIQTIDLWKRVHPKFQKALRRGKSEANANVAQAWYRRAIGYTVIEDHITNDKGTIIITPVRKHIPPDTQAFIKWMALRESENWSETQKFEVKQTHISITKIDLTGLGQAEMEIIEKLQLKQLTENAGDSRN